MRPPLYRLQKRRPSGRNIAWARLVHVPVGPWGEQSIEWRVFRRDLRGVTHMERVQLSAGLTREVAARHIRAARAQLRWRVDRLDFELLGLQDNAPQPEAIA